jgi:diguanylate cyclase (GGDEF)-like protein/PAS domain S-box-containing protein
MVAVAGLLITMAAVRQEQRRVEQTVDVELEHVADKVVQATAELLETYEVVLRGARGFTRAKDDEVNWNDWRQYCEQIGIVDHLGGIEGLALIQKVSIDEIAPFSDKIRSEYWPDFKIRPETHDDADRFVIRYHEPLSANYEAIGLDVSSVPEVREALGTAIATGRAILSHRIELAQRRTEDDRSGKVMYLALYDGGETPANPAERTEKVIGAVGLPVFIDTLFNRALDRADTKHKVVVVRDGSTGQAIWQSHRDVDLQAVASTDQLARRDLEAYGRSLKFVVAPSAASPAGVTAAWTALVIGLTGTTLLTTLVGVLTATRLRARRHAERMRQHAASNEAKFSAAFRGSGIGMGLADLSGRWISGNDALCKLLDILPGDLTDNGLQAMTHPAELERLIDALGTLISSRSRHADFEARFLRPSGTVWTHVSLSLVSPTLPKAGQAGGLENAYLVVQVRDVSDSKKLQKELAHAATHDALTNLPGRSAFEEALAACFTPTSSRLRVGHKGFAVLFLDLDNFKEINDTLGHEAGDQLLKGVAGRICKQLRASVRETPHAQGDMPARLGGDEFVILLDGVESAQAAIAVARRLRRSILEPFRVLGQEVSVGVSVGVATSFGRYGSSNAMLRHADLAMYRMKEAGKEAGRPLTDICLADDVEETLKLAIPHDEQRVAA